MMYRNKGGQMQTEVVTWMPDDDYWDDENRAKKPFNGMVVVKDWKGNFIKAFHYASNGKINSLKPAVTQNGKGMQIKEVGQNCYTVTTWSSVEVGNSGAPYYTWYTETYCDPYTGGGGDGGNGEPGNDGGSNNDSGGTSPGDYTPITEMPVPALPATFTEAELADATIVPDDKPGISDIDKFIDCFTNGQAGTYKLTIYVDQPVAGRNDQFRLIPPTGTMINPGVIIITSTGHFTPGHTFVGFEKYNADNTVTRQVLGFYPGGFSVASSGAIKDDSNHDFDVSYTVNVNEGQFNNALQQIKNDFSNAKYVLFPYADLANREYNCSDAGISWLNASGANLSNYPRGAFINTPGDFGQALRNFPNSNKMGGKAPSGNGPCK